MDRIGGYQRAPREGKAHATVPREYVKESTIAPDAFIVPRVSADMFKNYGGEVHGDDLEQLSDFQLTLGRTAQKDGIGLLQ